MAEVATLDRYTEALRRHLTGSADELALLQAYELGRGLVDEGAGLLDVLRLHMQAIGQLGDESVGEAAHVRTEGFLSEVLGPFEMAYLGFQEANQSLRTLTASLEEQVAERTREVQQSLSALQAADADRRRLLARLVEVQEDERRRLAEDLHDDAIQVMTAVGLRLAILGPRVDDASRPQLDRLEDTVRAAIGRLRRLVFELRPPALDHEGLAAAVRAYADEAFGDDVQVTVDDRLEDRPPVSLRENLYRILQEALANVRKHAGARRVEVVVEPHREGIRASVVDDGGGFDPRVLEVTRPGHLGTSGMRERAQMAGGWLHIESAPGAGTTVVCWLPRTEDATG